MTKLETLRDLLARVEAAEGPDVIIDLLIARTFGHRFVREDGTNQYSDNGQKHGDFLLQHPHPPAQFEIAKMMRLPQYTASIDTAVALIARVMPGWIWSVASEPGNKFEAELHEPWSYYGLGKGCGQMRGPALALCAVLLKALIAQVETRHHAIDEMVRVSQELDLP